MTLHAIIKTALEVSVVCSFVSNLLPNAKFLDAYPRAQKVYNALITFIAALALNMRHALPSVDLEAPVLGITKPVNLTQPQEKN